VSELGADNGHASSGGEETTRAPSAGRRALLDAAAARQRAQLVGQLRGLASLGRSSALALSAGSAGGPGLVASRAAGATDATSDAKVEERCDLCETTIPDDHRHLLNLVERRIECVCESCWALRCGDAEYRPVGGRTLWLADLEVSEEVWSSFQIPIGLAFFMESSVAGCVVALYPSPGGATESELHFASWSRMVELNPVLVDLEPDIEGLIVNRLSDPPAYAIAPIDRCYALTGTIKASWEGISGGPGVREAVSSFFEELRAQAVAA
jgi:hypothetical protein